MTISLDVKVPMLHEFHSYLYQPEWKYMESKEKDRQVLEDFPTVRCPPPCFSCLVSPWLSLCHTQACSVPTEPIALGAGHRAGVRNPSIVQFPV